MSLSLGSWIYLKNKWLYLPHVLLRTIDIQTFKMRFQYLHFSTLLGLAASAPLSTYGTSSSKSSPCGLITSQLEEYLKTSGSNSTVLFYFDSELANECLLSSVIDNDLAASFVVEYKKYVQFQSTLNYLKCMIYFILSSSWLFWL